MTTGKIAPALACYPRLGTLTCLGLFLLTFPAFAVTLDCNQGNFPATMVVNTLYNMSCLVTGAPGGFNTSVNGSLPAGMTYSSPANQIIFVGVPTAPGPYSFTLSVIDFAGGQASQSFAGTVVSSPISLTSASPGLLTAGQPATLTLTGAGFTPNSVAYLGGLSLATTYVSSTLLYATVPAASTISGTVSVWVADGASKSGTLSVTISGVALSSLSQTSVPVGSAGFTLFLYGSGFTPGIAVSFGNTALAATYISSNQLSVFISSTLLTTAQTVNVSVANSNSLPFVIRTGIVGLSVVCNPITGPTTIGAAYSQTCIAASGIAPYSWAASGLPAGLSQNNATGNALTISGTPTIAGSYSYTLQAIDSSSPHLIGSLAVSGTIAAPAYTLTSLQPSTVPVGSNQLYLVALGTGFTGASQVYFNGFPLATMYISATQLDAIVPQSLLTFAQSALVTVNTSGVTTNSLPFNVSLLTTGGPLTMSCASGVGPSMLGVFYTNTCTASGGNGNYLWSGPNDPNSLHYLSNTGPSFTVFGPPTGSGPYTDVITVTDSGAPQQTASLTLAGEIVFLRGGTGGIVVNSISPSTATLNAPPVNLTVNGTGFTPASQLIFGGTPLSTTFVSSNQLTAVIPSTLLTQTTTPGIYVLTPGSLNSNTVAFPIGNVGSAIQMSIECASGVGPSAPNSNYSNTCAVNGGRLPVSWSISSGALPSGLSLTTSGPLATISGFTTYSGIYSYKLQVADSSVPPNTYFVQFAGATTPVTVASKLAFATQPSGGFAGTPLSPVIVQILDQFGNLVSTATNPVTLLSNALGAPQIVNAQNGIATFNGLTFNTPGVYNLTAYSAGLDGALSNTFTIAAQTYSISGQITLSGGPLAGVTVFLGGSQATTTITSATGAYTFTGLSAGGTYTLTPTISGYVFNPPSQTFTNLSANLIANFQATPIIAGVSWYYLIESEPRTLPGASASHDGISVFVNIAAGPVTACANYITLSDSAPHTLCQSSPFQFVRLDFGTGVENFHVGSISVGDSAGFQTVNAPVPGTLYSQSATYFVASGKVTSSGAPLPGVTINVNGSQSASTTTDNNGSYAIAVLAGGVYTISAAAAGYGFNPPINTSNVLADLFANFTGFPLSGLVFVPVSPCRIADTRAAANFPVPFGAPTMAAGETRSYKLPMSSCNIPASAAAYSLNFTVVPPASGRLGLLTTYPTGQARPNVSTLNSYTGAVVANAAIVPAGANGSIDVYVSDRTDVLFDINGYFTPEPSPTGLAFYPVAPCRVADTRAAANFAAPFGAPSMQAGQTRVFGIPGSSCGIPSTAAAYSLNFTAVPPVSGHLGLLTTWPGGPRPNASTLNSYAGTVVANAAIVPASISGAISVYVSDLTDVLFDINGYFGSVTTSGLSFYPVTPCRIADTRPAAGFPSPFGAPTLAAGETRAFPVPSSSCGIPSTAQAYSLNVTVVPPTPGYLGLLTTWPAGLARPNASTLNSYTGTVVANAAIVPAGASGAVNVYVSDQTDVILDINGYFAP